MRKLNKPWGEERWLELNDKYCYKRLFVKAGHKLSLQYHKQKVETNFIVEGEAEVWLGKENGEIEKIKMSAGEFYTVPSMQIHRVIAITNIVLLEVSSPEVDDIIRIEDETGRGDGRIKEEHNEQ